MIHGAIAVAVTSVVRDCLTHRSQSSSQFVALGDTLGNLDTQFVVLGLAT